MDPWSCFKVFLGTGQYLLLFLALYLRHVFRSSDFEIFFAGFRHYIFIPAFWFCLQTARAGENVSVTRTSVHHGSIHFSHA